MARESIIYLTQRTPYPPHSGDRNRAFHLLRGLSERYDVHLGSFGDPSVKIAHQLREICASVFIDRLQPRRFGGVVTAFAKNRPLTPAMLRSRAMEDWLQLTVGSSTPVAAIVSSVALAPYLEALDVPRRVVDYVDVDSEKWNLIGARSRGISGAMYRREGERLATLEGHVLSWVDAAVVVSEEEALVLRSRGEAPERVQVVPNGVDTASFNSEVTFDRPYPPGVAAPMVFTGVMDYWPNIDAVDWFASECLAQIRLTVPEAEFWIVGARPTRAVRSLERLPGVVVTGSVVDVRPYLQHAHLAVAPMRVAPGVQNKVLEAMAMAKAVLATTDAVAGLPFDVEMTSEPDSASLARQAVALLGANDLAAIGVRNRQRVCNHSSWRTSTTAMVRCVSGHVL